jgi:hypothetical protein
MKKFRTMPRRLTAAERGHLVQRVTVDGWSHSKAAAFGLPRPVADAWVAEFRRQGMASLRSPSSLTVAAEMALAQMVIRLRSVWLRLAPQQHSGPSSPGGRFDRAGRT